MSRSASPTSPSSISSTAFEDFISEKYQLLDRIGEGTYGQVYKAVSLATSSHVAIKRIPHVKDYGLRCAIEPFIMSSITHKNILPASEIISHPSFTCIVMPCAKDDVFNYIKTHPSTLSLDQRLKWCWDVCQGLACLHQNNIIHGDIKSCNCMIMQDMTLKLGDFTLSVLDCYRNQTHTHNACTFTHRPPEIMLNLPWEKSIDIWALGCTLYEIIYGKILFPYQGDPSKNNGSVDDDLLITKMLMCYKDWGVTTNQPVGYLKFASKRSIKYLMPVNQFKDEPLYYAINDLILTCLQLDPQERPTMQSILKHSAFNKHFNIYQYSCYHRKEITIPTWTVMAELDDALKSCSDFLHPQVKDLFLSVYQLEFNISLSLQLIAWVCVFMIVKITHNSLSLIPPFSWTEINNAEQVISKQLHWKFPF